MSPRQLSLVLAGGVSLGAWEAGALTELLYAVDLLARERDDRWEIDVLTGGSAGAITAALAARGILHDRRAMAEALHEAWVVAVDARRFLRHPGTGSLVTNAVQDELAQRYLGPGSIVPWQASSDRFPRPTGNLRLGFALSNMVGVDYGIPYTQTPGSLPDTDAAGFVSTFFSDNAAFSLGPHNRNDPGTWWQVAAAAMASGSFPLVFPPGVLLRTRNDYPGALATNSLPRQTQFVDGGAFNNEPLRLAIDLSAKNDGHTASSDRTFILLDPRLNRTKRDESFARPHRFVDNALRVIQMIVGEAAARDWLRAGRVTERLSHRDDLAAALAALVGALPESSVDAQLAAARGRVEGIATGAAGRNRNGDPGAFVRDALAAIVARHADVTSSLGSDDTPSIRSLRLRLFAHLMYLSDAASGGLTRAPLRLFAVTSTPGLTAGDPLRGFLGFLDERWREHDFRLGRRDAHNRLPEVLGVDPWPRESAGEHPSHNPLYDPEPDWGDLSRVDVSSADPDIRNALREFLVHSADRLLGEQPLRASPVFRFLVRLWLDRRLRRAFERRTE